MKIGNKEIGSRTYVIAEFGVNHNGSLERAKEGIRKAAAAGADAIKFQTYTAEELVVKDTPKFWEFEGDNGKSQFDAYKEIGGFPYAWYPELIECCKIHEIEFLSTPFSFEAADFLNDLGMKAFKVASSDMSHIPFLKHIARYQKPILLSTGASTLEEIKEAVDAIMSEGNSQIVILHCTLCYPTMYPDKEIHYEDANLNIIQTLKMEFPFLQVGISDHTMTSFSSVIAAAMGATVIEKHYTVDKTLGKSADHWFSVDPTELGEIVTGCRKVELLKGSGHKRVFECETETRKYDKRSIVSKIAIPTGTKITADMLTYKRPGTGIWPKFDEIVIGKTASQDIPADTTLTWKML